MTRSQDGPYKILAHRRLKYLLFIITRQFFKFTDGFLVPLLVEEAPTDILVNVQMRRVRGQSGYDNFLHSIPSVLTVLAVQKSSSFTPFGLVRGLQMFTWVRVIFVDGLVLNVFSIIKSLQRRMIHQDTLISNVK